MPEANQQTIANGEGKTDVDLSAIDDNLPLSSIWRQTVKEIFSSAGVITLAVLVFSIFMLIFAVLLLQAATGPNPAQTLLAIIFVFAVLLIVVLSFVLKTAKKIRILLRASSLARTNGFSIVKGLKEPAYPGLIFSIGDTRRATSIVEGSYKNHAFTIFNYSYMEGSGKNRDEHNKGIIMIKLPRKIPNVVFDSKANDIFGMSSLGTVLNRSQRFTFEGDFNKHFDVYAPKNYGPDVLYFMTPELMALLVDEANNYDVEVVDDNLFFYAPEFDFKRQQLAKIFKLISSIGGEFSENTQRYADERVGDKNINMIAEPGRRLKRGISWITVLGIAFYIIIWVLGQIANNR